MRLEIRGLKFSYNDHVAIDSIDASFETGKAVGIVGPNGSGKTTLLKLIAGILPASDGEILLDGFIADPGELRKHVGYVFQNPDNQIIGSTVLEDVAFGLENMGVPREKMPERIRWALEKVEMWELRERNPSTLSGGQKQRLAVASMLAVSPAFLALDEPTSMLDMKGREEVLVVLKKLKAEGHGIIIATHDVYEMLLCDEILVLDGGKVRFHVTLGSGWSRELARYLPESFEIKIADFCGVNPLNLRELIHVGDFT